MPRTKGSKNGTSKVGATKHKAPKATARPSKADKPKNGSSVHRSTKDVLKPTVREYGLENKSVSSSKVASTTRQPRAKKALPKQQKEVTVYHYDHVDAWDWFMIATGVIVLILVGFIAAKVLS